MTSEPLVTLCAVNKTSRDMFFDVSRSLYLVHDARCPSKVPVSSSSFCKRLLQNSNAPDDRRSAVHSKSIDEPSISWRSGESLRVIPYEWSRIGTRVFSHLSANSSPDFLRVSFHTRSTSPLFAETATHLHPSWL